MTRKADPARERRNPGAFHKKKLKPTFDKLRPVRLFEQAAEKIQAMIVDGHLTPGEQLPSESELKDMFEISRSSVREALRALESKGLIEVRTGAGAFVAVQPFPLNNTEAAVQWLMNRKESLLQQLQVRQVLELLTTTLASQSISEETLTELREILQRQDRLDSALQDPDQYIALDVRFHLLIAQASGNSVAEDLLRSIVQAFWEGNKAILHLARNSHASLKEHRRILEALRARDPARAEAAVRAHLARVQHDVESIGAGSHLPRNAM